MRCYILNIDQSKEKEIQGAKMDVGFWIQNKREGKEKGRLFSMISVLVKLVQHHKI